MGNIRFRFQGYARSKLRFTTEALRLAGQGARLIVAGHPNLAVPASVIRTRSSPLVVLSHGVEVWKPLSPLRRACLRRVDCVLAPSRDTALKLHEIQGVPERNIRVLHWGLDPSFLELSNFAEGLALPNSIPKGRYVLAVGRWSSAERYKGFDTLIRALPELLNVAANFHLVFVGEGDDQPSLERVASEFQVMSHVHFLSRLSLEELIAVYAHADVFALPSGGEGFGLVFLEAMALGKAVVGGNHGGIPDIIVDGVTGFLVPHGNVAQLVQKLKLLLGNPMVREDMGQRGRERVLQHFRFESFEAGFRKIVADLCLK